MSARSASALPAATSCGLYADIPIYHDAPTVPVAERTARAVLIDGPWWISFGG